MVDSHFKVGEDVLILACKSGCVENVSAILSHGIDIELVDDVSLFSRTLPGIIIIIIFIYLLFWLL